MSGGAFRREDGVEEMNGRTCFAMAVTAMMLLGGGGDDDVL